MDRTNNPKNTNQLPVPIVLIPLWLLLGFFIGIGNIVRALFRYFIRIPVKTYKIISVVFRELTNAFRDWMQEKHSAIPMKRGRGRPRKIEITLYERKSLARHVQGKMVVLYSAARLRVSAGVLKFRTAIKNWKYEQLEKQKIRQEYKRIRKSKQLQIKIATRRMFTWPVITFPKFHFPKSDTTIQPSIEPTLIQKQSTNWDIIKSFITGVAITIIFVFAPYEAYHWLKSLPNPQLLSRRDLQVTSKIFDRNGVLLYEIYADQNRSPLPLVEIPDVLKHATIAIEDRDFYKHQGISLRGILRASRETILHKQVQGGSTITQQLIKSALLSPEFKITRKVKEILLAFWAERMYSKNQILEMYLNQVPYGGTAWGVETASQTYFGKSVKQITLAEAALLAGLPAAPTDYSPFGSNPQKAFQRQKEVLRRMVEDKYITRAQADAALSTDITFTQPKTSIRAPHFVMYVKNILEQQYGERLVEQGGLQIRTSLDISIQDKAEDILKNQIDSLATLQVGNGAAVVTKPKTGEILAMVGSKNYFDILSEGNVNVTTSLRQPGSSIKVINYAAALENGFTAASLLDDSPVSYKSEGSPAYSPVNYDGRYHGLVPFRYALANSYNIPAVKILAKIGVQEMIQKGKDMGITTWEDENRFGLSLTLGGGEVTMLDMAKVFGVLANSGKRVDLMPILEVTDYTGRVYQRNGKKAGIQVLKPETSWIISNILSDNTARMSAFGPSSSLVVKGKTVSVKTGTTDNKRDNWTIGYTPSYVTAVWVGNNNNSPMHPQLASGITGAAPIWHDIMEELLKNLPDEIPVKPESVLSIPCYFGRPEYFISGTEPVNGRCQQMPTPTASPTP